MAGMGDNDGAAKSGESEIERLVRQEEELDKLALEAILMKAKQDKKRADQEGVGAWAGSSRPTTNKRFANSLVASTVISNERTKERDRYERKRADLGIDGYHERKRRHDDDIEYDRKRDRKRGKERKRHDYDRDHRRERRHEMEEDHERERRRDYKIEHERRRHKDEADGEHKRERRRDFDSERSEGRRRDHEMERDRKKEKRK